MLALSGVGLFLYRSHGFPERLPEFIKNLKTPNLTDDSIPELQAWRINKCFLHKTGSKFSETECVDPESIKGPLVFIWGDSHAASLYSGLSKLQEKYEFRVAQFTQSKCPPWIYSNTSELDECESKNQFILEKIKNLIPDTVLLYANWSDNWERQKGEVNLPKSISKLKSYGIKRIILLGPTPQWKVSIQMAIVQSFKLSLKWNQIFPKRIKNTLHQNFLSDWGEAQKNIALQNNIIYISSQEVLCNVDGCLTSITDNENELTFLDSGHLSPFGATFLVESFIDRLFPEPLNRKK
ncbi:MAG: hypothetical protein HS129_07190 [Leptospiraceae bacterium]|nr:hypothetical protein [Leptospiraceae bacterium]